MLIFKHSTLRVNNPANSLDYGSHFYMSFLRFQDGHITFAENGNDLFPVPSQPIIHVAQLEVTCESTRNNPKFSDRYAWANSAYPAQRSSLIRVYTVCHSVCIIWTHFSMVEPHSSNFRLITTIFLGVLIFRKLTVCALVTGLLIVGLSLSSILNFPPSTRPWRGRKTSNVARQTNLCLRVFRVMTNFNCACPAIQRCQESGFLSESSSWLTACMSEQGRFWRDCADEQARMNLRCSHKR